MDRSFGILIALCGAWLAICCKPFTAPHTWGRTLATMLYAFIAIGGVLIVVGVDSHTIERLFWFTMFLAGCGVIVNGLAIEAGPTNGLGGVVIAVLGAIALIFGIVGMVNPMFQ